MTPVEPFSITVSNNNNNSSSSSTSTSNKAKNKTSSLTTKVITDRFKLNEKKTEITYRASGMFSIAARLSG